MNKIYSGIGSRKCPLDILLLMHDIGIYLAQKGYTLRSGGCEGADLAFENACDEVKGKKEIYLAENCTEQSMRLAEILHPCWHKVNTPFKRKLLGRNPLIILGQNLDIPSNSVIYWAEENRKTGKVEGGTRTGVELARENGIRTFNLYFEDVRKKFMDKIYYGGK
jgi:hypothetical protein